MLRVILPQLLPRLLVSLRLMLGSAWLFLIAAEAIASTDGLGYRIFLVRRYLAMDVILPYVVWITLLAWLMDWGAQAPHPPCLPLVSKERPHELHHRQNVWQQYGDQVVLEGLNLNVNEGEFCTLVGASGCGKSTFLRLLLGQERASRGEILLDGQPLAGEPDASRGVVFQRYSVFPHLSVLRQRRPRPRTAALALARTPVRRAKNEAPRTGFGAAAQRSAWATRWTSTRRSCPAACSNGWPSRRR